MNENLDNSANKVTTQNEVTTPLPLRGGAGGRAYIYPILAVIVFAVSQGIISVAVMLPGIIKDMAEAKEHAAIDPMALISPVSLALSVILSGIVTIGVLTLMKMVDWRKTLDFGAVCWTKGAWCVVAALLGCFALDLASEILALPNLLEEQFTGMASTVIGALAIGVVGPVCEEFIFREAVLGHMLRHNVSPWKAIILSALAFGIIHGNPAQIPFAAAVGVILGFIYWKTGSIIIPSIIHIINNSNAVVQMNVLGDRVADFSMVEWIGGTGVAIAVAVVCLGLCVWILKRNN